MSCGSLVTELGPESRPPSPTHVWGSPAPPFGRVPILPGSRSGRRVPSQATPPLPADHTAGWGRAETTGSRALPAGGSTGFQERRQKCLKPGAMSASAARSACLSSSRGVPGPTSLSFRGESSLSSPPPRSRSPPPTRAVPCVWLHPSLHFPGCEGSPVFQGVTLTPTLRPPQQNPGLAMGCPQQDSLTDLSEGPREPCVHSHRL